MIGWRGYRDGITIALLNNQGVNEGSKTRAVNVSERKMATGEIQVRRKIVVANSGEQTTRIQNNKCLPAALDSHTPPSETRIREGKGRGVSEKYQGSISIAAR
jgi:hypothetical protein